MTRTPSRTMGRNPTRTLAFLSLVVLPTAGAPLIGQTPDTPRAPAPSATDSDTVRPGPFDFGKMWTFEYPPAEHFSSTYGFDASPEWFEHARLAALRIPGCSAAFVSPHGLVVTNHHCARGAISSVSGPGERLLDEGFYAARVEDERPIPGYWADQLVAVEDVTEEIYAAMDAAPGDARAEARRQAVDAVRARVADEHATGAGDVLVQIVPLYDGGRYSAYAFRRYTDIRLVAAVELDLGFFGGDPDNFTYPRYALDFAFYRVYGADGQPLETPHWFTWGEGVDEGDPVFVIGNPGPTNRLKTVAQLEYQRDVLVPVRKAWFESRLAAFRDAYEADPEEGERVGLRNQAFSLSNSLKAYTGRLAALWDETILARKAAAERELTAALGADPGLATEYGDVVSGLAAAQERLRTVADEQGAFYRLADGTYGSRALLRAFQALAATGAKAAGADPDSLAALREGIASIPDHPGSLEEDLLTLRLRDLERYLGPGDELVESALEGRSPEGAGASILGRSVFASRAALAEALTGAGIPDDDPLLALAAALAPRMGRYQSRSAELSETEAELEADLGRARFAVYGTAVAPDATSSPRITDGVVKGYEYNGTLAPPHTTLFGLYDRYYSHGDHLEWQLGERWLPVPADLDLSTPLNFASTADTYGGNSGSPAVTPELALVGLNFDRNIEGLSRDFIYLPERGRNVMVDVRAIRESLDVVYDADRIVVEIVTGELVPSEAEADARPLRRKAPIP